MRNVATLVLGGGRGTRLSPLTKYRSKPAVPLAGKYRLIDIPLSNCINSELNHIYVLTQFLSVSLHRHIRQTYRFDTFGGGFVELLAAQQTDEKGTDWYEGTADAVRKNIRYLELPGIDYVLILSGDQLYRMDYREMLATHIDSGAEATIAGIPVDRKDAGGLGIMRLDETGRVQGFLEKPQTDDEIDIVAMPPEWIDEQGIESRGRDCIASMGIYVFNSQFLIDVLKKTSYQDFGREVFPAAVRSRHVQTHLFDGYWEDIGTIQAFFDANLSLAKPDPPFSLISREAPVYSRGRYLPPSQVSGATISDSMIADGCRIGKGVVIENSVIGLRCFIGDNTVIRNSILMGADEYDSEVERAEHDAQGHPQLGIGSDCRIEGSIIDKNCRIGSGVKIVANTEIGDRVETEGCAVREGIPCVVKDAVIPNGWELK